MKTTKNNRDVIKKTWSHVQCWGGSFHFNVDYMYMYMYPHPQTEILID